MGLLQCEGYLCSDLTGFPSIHFQTFEFCIGNWFYFCVVYVHDMYPYQFSCNALHSVFGFSILSNFPHRIRIKLRLL